MNSVAEGLSDTVSVNQEYFEVADQITYPIRAAHLALQ
jgi:hypothetical protein